MTAKIVFSLFILTCFTCSNYAQTKNQKVQPVKFPIILEVNNKDYKKIGFELVQDDESTGVKSILLQGRDIYLADTYHSNIKKVNILTNKPSSSLPLSKNRAWVRDIAIFDKKLFVITDLESNYILDLNLNIIKSFKLPLGEKSVFKVFKDSLLVYNLGNVITITNNGDIISIRKEYVNMSGMTHGKHFSINNMENIVKTEYGFAHLSGHFPYTGEKYYTAINIDFNEKELVYFEVNPKYLKIFREPIELSK